ncbi:MAG: DUF4397 domain-containing protein [bacterium]
MKLLNRPLTSGRGTRLAAAAGLAVLTAASSLAMAGPAAAAAPADAVIRAAHFSPTTPGVDVYLGSFSGASSKPWLGGVSYGAVSPYQRLTPGLYTVSMRPAGAPASTKPVLSWTLNAKSGQAYTVAGVGADASVRGVVIRDDLSTPPSGKGRVRVIQAASRAPVATVTATSGPVIARNAAFATTTGYATVDAGTWKVTARSDNASPTVSASTAVDVPAGAVTSVLLLDAKSAGITLRTVLDSSSAGTLPKGSVPAGAGGTAPITLAVSATTIERQLAGLAALILLGYGAVLLGGQRRRYARV